MKTIKRKVKKNHKCSMKNTKLIDLPDGSTMIFCSICNKRLGEFS